jgi:hypothetical protein
LSGAQLVDAADQRAKAASPQHRASIILLISSGAAKITSARVAFPKGAGLSIDGGDAIGIVAIADRLDLLAGFIRQVPECIEAG